MSQPKIAEKPDSSPNWVLLDVLQFVNNLHLSVRIDDPLDISMRRIFTEAVGKFATYAHCSNGLHLLANTIYKPDQKTVEVLEIHHLYVEPSNRVFLNCALEQRQPIQKVFSCADGRPLYVRSEGKGITAATGIHTVLQDVLPQQNVFIPEIASKNDHWGHILSFLNDDRAKAKLPLIECNATKLLVIPLSKPDGKMPGGILGTIVLWQNENDQVDRLWESRAERLILAAKIIGRFLARLFAAHYGVTDATFLPSYQVAGPKSVGIMFADIRDFTPTMEIARNFRLDLDVQEFMRDYCREMSKIIVANGGRVGGYSGDGIMALFGEYDLNPMETMTRAVEAAKQMVTSFDQLKKTFLGKAPIQNFLKRAVEPLDFRLGIGINFGEVIFDYFGSEGSRVYSALGDHVNFAQRLESQAARHDDRVPGGMRAPILLSRPAWMAGEFDKKFPDQPP